jgi:hypothetical protein
MGGETAAGLAGFFPLIILIVIGAVLAKRRSGGTIISGPSLVLRKFSVKKDGSNGYIIEIIGRASGVIAWLLTVMKLDTETSLKISQKDILFKSSSLFGQIYQVSPLPSVSSTHCGYSKPIGYLIFGAIFMGGGLLWGSAQYQGGGIMLGGLLIGLVFFIAYWLSKKIAISIQTKGGMIMGLSFRRSVIENIPVDIKKAMQAISLINKNVIASQKVKLPLRPKAAQKS